jgi:hypothetical protein
MKRNLKHHVDGMQTGVPLPFAEKKLKDMENGSTLFYTALNGQCLFIKENDAVRIATDKETNEYIKEKIKYRNKLSKG